MKKILLVVLVLLLECVSFAQQIPQKTDYTFIPRTLFAGTSMSARTYSVTYDDTTQSFSLNGWSSGYLLFNIATNDSVNLNFSYAGSYDGVNFGEYVVSDSVKMTGTASNVRTLQIPQKAFGFLSIRARVYATGIAYSQNPSAVLTTRIRLKH
jgi:hypothetical protein